MLEPKGNKNSKLFLFFVIFATCLGILLSVNLGKSPFWIDESITVAQAKRLNAGFTIPSSALEFTPFAWRTQGDIPHLEPSMLSYQAVVAIFFRIFGVSEFSIRFPSVISALLLLFMTFLLCKKFYGEKIALLASLLLGTSVGFIFYTTQAIYVMFTSSLVYISLYLLLKLLTENKLKQYIVYPIFLFLTLISHPLAYLLVPISMIIAIYFGEIKFWKYNYRRIILAMFIFIILYVPFLLFFHESLPFFHKLNSSNMISAYHSSLLFYPKVIMHELSSELFEEQITSPLFFSFKWLFFITGLCFLVIRFIRRDSTGILLSILLFLPLFFLSLFDLKSGRYLLLYLLPPISICLALGITQISKLAGRFAKQAVAFLLILGIFFPSVRSQDIPFKQLLVYKNAFLPPEDNFQAIKFQYEFLNEYAREDDAIITTSDHPGLWYYTKRRIYGFLNPYNSDEFFMHIVKNMPRVWVVDNLPVFDFCLDIEPNIGEYEAISAMEKYSSFIHYYRNRCRVIVQNDQLRRMGFTTKIYLCEKQE